MTEPKKDDTPSSQKSFIKSGIYLLPNSFTLAALFSGFYGIVQAMNGRFELAAIAVFISMILDGMDGRVARMTHSQSDFGAEFDSLADMVSFGVAPALIAYEWQLQAFGRLGWAVAFIYCACAAMRLALFNTMVGKTDKRWFVGIPSPTAAALVCGLVWISHEYETMPYVGWIAVVLTAFAGLSMVVPVKFWSFKELHVRRKMPFFTLLISIVILLLLVLEPALVLFSFFVLYSLSGYVHYVWSALKKPKSAA
ncbi:CDP-diacylglycerol--serine O-phosphatidyltransferase [Neisseriaceae bacterium CLB008]|nr:CDP-diacylglycerol--serine O-phosphatidyltransferase [Neisseriaceae bacterium]